MAATTGSSAPRTATPPSWAAGRASTSSPLACAIASREPNSPRWAEPTLRTTPIRGGATRHRAATWPGPRAESSRTRWRVSGVGAQRGPGVAELVVERAGRGDGRAGRLEQVRGEVLGRRLARRAGDADDGQAPGGRGCRRRGAPARRARRGPRPRRRRRRRPARRSPGIRVTGGTITAGASTSRAASTPAAPAAIAAATKSCPSTRSPGSATNSPPGVDRAAVELDGAGDALVPRGAVQPPAGDAGDVGEGQLDHRGPPWARTSARSSSSTSENGSFSAPDLLAGLVALAGDHDDVARGAPRPRPRAMAARRSPISSTRAPGDLAGAVEHRGADRGRVLGAGVVVGDPEVVGELGAQPAHHRALGAVAVAAAAQHGEHAPAVLGGLGPQRLEQRADRGRLVRVVDDGEERLAGLDALHPPGHADLGEPAGQHGGVLARGVPAGEGEQRVGDVEGARQPQGHRQREPVRAVGGEPLRAVGQRDDVARRASRPRGCRR